MAEPLAMPLTAQAVQDAMVLVQQAWIALAGASSMPPHDQSAYIAGLTTPQSLVYPDGGDPLAGRVVNRARQAPRIELGTPAIHLPSVIRWAQSRAARRSKAGRYYLVVPFRHFATRYGKQIAELRPAARRQMMPEAVYRRASRMGRRQYLTAGESRGRAVHAPGLTPYVPRNPLNVRPGYQHASIYERLRREPSSRGARFQTYRTMTQDSSGWWLPARPGVQLQQQLEREVRPQITAMLTAAVEQDIRAHLGQIGS